MALFTLLCVIFVAFTDTDVDCYVKVFSIDRLTSGVGVLPDSVDAALGGTVVFNTSLAPTQTPFTTVIWQFGTKNIITSTTTNTTGPEYKDRITLFMSTGSLELRAVALTDAGEYRVTILTAGGGSIISGATKLNVYEKISEASVKSSTPMPLERTFVNLTCDASGSNITREWTKDGVSLKPSENIVFFDQNRVVSFKNLNRKDKGSYTCKISNPISSQDATYVLNVNYGPDNVQILGPKEVQEKTKLELICSADSVPAANYTWIKNKTTIGHTSEYIKDITEYSDSGDYICLSTNFITGGTFKVLHTLAVTAPKDGLSAGAITGITIVCLVVVGGVIAGGLYVYKNKNGKKQNNSLQAQNVYENTSNVCMFNTDTGNKHIYENTAQIYDKTPFKHCKK